MTTTSSSETNRRSNLGVKVLLWIIAAVAFMPVLFDVLASNGAWRATGIIPRPVFKESGNAFMTYAPAPDLAFPFTTEPFLKPGNKNTLRLFAGGRELLPCASLDEVRQVGDGRCVQNGLLIWFAMPGNGDANTQNVDLTYSTPLFLKDRLRPIAYGLFGFTLLLAALSGPITAFAARVRQQPAVSAIVDPIARTVGNLSTYLSDRKWVLLAITALIGTRLCLPTMFNFLDSYSLLTNPRGVVGLWPPLYPALIHFFKEINGAGPGFLNSLMGLQLTCFAVALFYLCEAFNNTKQKLVVVACVALNYYALLIAGGIMTESIGLTALLLVFGSALRIIQQKGKVLPFVVYSFACVICILCRHTFVIMAGVLPAYAFFRMFVRDGHSFKHWLTRCVAYAVLLFASIGFGQGLASWTGSMFCSTGKYYVPMGAIGAQAMPRLWQRIPDEDRFPTYEKLAAQTDDPLVKAVFKTLLQLPNSNQQYYFTDKIFQGVRDYVAKNGTEEDKKRVVQYAELEAAAGKATKLYYMNMDRHMAEMWLECFLQYTQVRELSKPNPQFNFATIKAIDLQDRLGGVAINSIAIQNGYLNRALLYNSGMSSMWTKLVPGLSKMTDHVFTPDAQDRLRQCINSRLFWFLDFFNPANNLIGLLALLSTGVLFRRLSSTAILYTTSGLIAILLYYALHGITGQEALSRYLAPASLSLALACAVLVMEWLGLRPFAASQPANSTVKELAPKEDRELVASGRS